MKKNNNNNDKSVTIDTFKELALDSKDAKEFLSKSKLIKNVPADVADEFCDKYGNGGLLSQEETAEIFYNEVKDDFYQNMPKKQVKELVEYWSMLKNSYNKGITKLDKKEIAKLKEVQKYVDKFNPEYNKMFHSKE